MPATSGTETGSTSNGSAKPRMGSPWCAARMYRFHICAGRLPPNTWGSPWMLYSERRVSSGYPSHTTVAYWGVYPANHASVYSSVVPVLPATGRPIWPLVRPVPRVMTPCRRSVPSAVTEEEIVRSQSGCSLMRVLPDASSTRVIANGSQRTPSAAIVA